MAQGWQSGDQCFETIEATAAHACGRSFEVVGAVGSSGALLSCTGYTVTGGEVELTLTSGTTSTVVPWIPMECSRFDYAGTWGPLAAAALVGAVVIWSIQELIGYFRKDHEL